MSCAEVDALVHSAADQPHAIVTGWNTEKEKTRECLRSSRCLIIQKTSCRFQIPLKNHLRKSSRNQRDREALTNKNPLDHTCTHPLLFRQAAAAAAAAFKLKENREATLRRTEMKGRITKRETESEREAQRLKWLTGKADGSYGRGVLV